MEKSYLRYEATSEAGLATTETADVFSTDSFFVSPQTSERRFTFIILGSIFKRLGSIAK